MGLITEEVQVTIQANNVKYYENLGYTIPLRKPTKSMSYKKDIVYDIGNFITVKIEDLQKGSHIMVDCLCDYCQENVVTIPYKKYIQITNSDIPKVTCKNCCSLKQKESIKNTYGVESIFQLEEFREKVRETNRQRRGVDYPTQSPIVKNKMRKNNQQKYGVDFVSQLDWVKEKKKITALQHYGVENCFQSEIIKEKIRYNNRQKYGVDYTLQTKEVREKSRKTMYKNQTAPTSKQQKYLCNLFGGELNYPIECYSGDIVLLDSMIDVEYSGGGHFLSIIYGSETEESFLKRQITRYNILKRNHYKQIEIISRKDYLPSDEVLLQMLEDAKRYFKDYPNHSWFEFDIDKNIYRNAENLNGVPYFYGKLRKIKESDLESA